ncbi:hypothetical protein NPIL_212851 [Nephila pilipes]|uniref:Uncharacterized protein n=1 Tax=Nephila pilipes TaxID=299642 RepID=A0A8X6ULK0_NEPPI|nr:hypothetical protein NPIL_212851 [Nephila pilipes]
MILKRWAKLFACQANKPKFGSKRQALLPHSIKQQTKLPACFLYMANTRLATPYAETAGLYAARLPSHTAATCRTIPPLANLLAKLANAAAPGNA